MTTGRSPLSIRRALIVAPILAALGGGLAAVGGSTGAAGVQVTGTAGTSLPPKANSVGPDVVVFAFTDIGNYGSSAGWVGYAIGTRSCNRGDTPLNWCDQASGCAAGAGTEDHPVIAGNLYRVKGGRLEQIGMSWLKHGFTSTNSTTAGCTGSAGQSCTSPPAGGNQLGVGCTDPYTSGLNGSRPLGRRSEVSATTGVFPFPPSSPGGPYTVFDQRIKVATTDVDPVQNPGATYWAESQYIAGDDALAGNGLNNASYRQVTVGGSPNFSLTMTGTFFEQQSAINAWRLGPPLDPAVYVTNVDLPGSPVERYQVARKVTDLGGGLWRYEYAVRNHNSDRSARGFKVEFPAATNFTNVGFKDIESHSGEPYATTDWSVTTTATAVSWFTDDFATNANANALRFAMMFDFWFDADQPPTDDTVHTLDMFTPGTPTSVAFSGSKYTNLFANGFESGAYDAWNGHS